MQGSRPKSCFFFFNDTATTEIYTLSLHDALPISFQLNPIAGAQSCRSLPFRFAEIPGFGERSEEHTSELQSQSNLVCRLLLEKKKREHAPGILVTQQPQRPDCRAGDDVHRTHQPD